MKKRIFCVMFTLCLCAGLLSACAHSSNMDDVSQTAINVSAETQANLSNLGGVVTVGDKTYVSNFLSDEFGTNGIYLYVSPDSALYNTLFEYDSECINDSYGNAYGLLMLEGSYWDMAAIGDKIYCVEYDTVNDLNRLLAISTEDFSTEVLFESPYNNENFWITGRNIIDGNYYFTLCDDLLCYVGEDKEVHRTDIRNVINVSGSGVFTTETGDRGLQLVSFDNTSPKTYSQLSGKKVTIMFEKDDYAFISATTGNFLDEFTTDEECALFKLDIKTGELIDFPEDRTIFDQCVSCYINFSGGDNYGDNYYFTVTKTGQYPGDAYFTYGDGSHLMKIGEGIGGMIGIGSEKLFIGMPLESKTILNLNLSEEDGSGGGSSVAEDI